jgi:hypothetical protein
LSDVEPPPLKEAGESLILMECAKGVEHVVEMKQVAKFTLAYEIVLL